MKPLTPLIFCLALIVGFAAPFGGCKDDTIQPPPTTVPVLSLLDKNCTEAWINVKASLLPAATGINTLSVTQGSRRLLSLSLPHPDTVLYIDSLLPNRGYRVKSERRYTGISFVDSSEQLTFTTLDSTSHSFTWQTQSLGDGNSSALYDVAIINDTLVYAVGEISVRDSSGNLINPPCNIAKWNGASWELSTSSDAGYGYGEIYCVFAFGPNDVWTGSTIPEHWDGTKWTFYGSTRGYPGGFRIKKIWGTSSQNLYVVGETGNMRHFDGHAWTKIESGTGTDINDAWGVTNPFTGKQEIYCPVTNFFVRQEQKILRITEAATVDSIPWGTGRDVVSVWTDKGMSFYTAGDGVYKSKAEGTWQEMNIGASIYTDRIRGTALNDIFSSGAFGLITHYNGVGWQVVLLNLNQGGYGGLAVGRNLVVAVGTDGARAIVAIGKR